MKFTILFLSLLLIPNLLFAQFNTYWQQKVSYNLQVSLNDSIDELTGFETIVYTNNSPQSLTYIYFHLWPNAYKNQQTAFAKQQLENGNTDFYYSTLSQRGFIDGLDFAVNGEKAKIELDVKNPDICKLILNSPLLSQSSITITTPFRVKIPETFSRLGHEGQAYQISQWYPKPAVFDNKGWHAFPYLDQGEFYSEFGDFEVSITLPDNYVVAATGTLQTETEIAWLTQKAIETQSKLSTWQNDEATNILKKINTKNTHDFPVSSKNSKTLFYKEQNIHDFAWFADKRYHVLKGSVTLQDGRKVDTWAMFTDYERNLWSKSINYLNDAILSYSKLVGNYPYKQCSAVQGALKAGGGMEYPTITIIGGCGSDLILDETILHEVGHNWFYGILGSNERNYPWMDEGLNSYYEYRIMQQKYPTATLNDAIKLPKIFHLNRFLLRDLPYYEYLITARKNIDQALSLSAEKYSTMNYGTTVYAKTALGVQNLAAYIGVPAFDTLMHRYFNLWKFKHPQPDDFKEIVTKNTPKNVDWFFDFWLDSNRKIDYKINSVKRNIKTIGTTAYDEISVSQPENHCWAPFSITAKYDSTNTLGKTIWYDGFQGNMKLLYPSSNYKTLQIDAKHEVPEENRNNNFYTPNTIFKKAKPVKLEFLGGLENPDRNQLFFIPLVGYNYYDKIMFGMAFYNSFIPVKKFEYIFAPMFGTGSLNFTGMGNITYSFYPKNTFMQRVQTKISGSTFGHGIFINNNLENPTNEIIQFYKVVPEIAIKMKENNPRAKMNRNLSIRHINIIRSKFDCIDPNVPDSLFSNCNNILYRSNYYINELTYKLESKRRINPYNYTFKVQNGRQFTMTSFETNYKFSFKGGKKRGLDLRWFIGGFIDNKTPQFDEKRLTISDIGILDYMFDNVYLKRNELSNPKDFLSRQIAMRYGGFKIANTVGNTDRFLTAVNLKSSLPFKLPFNLPIKVYADIGYVFASNDTLYNWAKQVLFDAGLAFTPIPDILEVYLPLVHSDYYQNIFKNQGIKWHQKISFLLDLDKLDPIEMIKDFEF